MKPKLLQVIVGRQIDAIDPEDHGLQTVLLDIIEGPACDDVKMGLGQKFKVTQRAMDQAVVNVSLMDKYEMRKSEDELKWPT